MQINSLVPLNWDTNFFGYPVARLSIGENEEENLEYAFQQINSENIRLTYIDVNPDNLALNKILEKKGCFLADQKVVFAKPSEKHHSFKNRITEFHGNETNEQLLSLALCSGLYSRFRIDKNFTSNEFEKLYTEWLINSINKTIAFTTLTAMEESDFIGITTIGIKSDYADIGLVAVSEDHRGKGIGFDLIHTADSIAFEKGFKEIKVTTQLKNNEACALYRKCNFRIERITNIYHYWK
jgi:dTDP-4-amino-4,6-dideoxy-D-galactose acyltransferase